MFNIRISESLFEKIEDIVEESDDLDNPTDFARYALREGIKSYSLKFSILNSPAAGDLRKLRSRINRVLDGDKE